MLIELFGCTGAGKSSLIRRLCDEGREPLVLADDFVLGRAGLGWLRGHLPRTLALDLLGLAACVPAWRRDRRFFGLLGRCIAALPRTAPWSQRLNIARNVLKRAGLHEILRRKVPADRLVVVDEGTLHSAHALFVHVSAPPDTALLDGFLEHVPLPDVAVHVRGDAPELVRRTLARGHGRIPDSAPDAAALFVERSLRVSARIAADPRVGPGLLLVDPATGDVAPAQPAADPDVERARRLLGSLGAAA